MITVTEDEVVSATRAIVAERPDYVYTNPKGEVAGPGNTFCYYVHKSENGLQPGCLVGAVLHRLGVPLDELHASEGPGSETADNIVPMFLDTSRAAVDFLSKVQWMQDNGQTWADALAYAEEHTVSAPCAS